MDLKTKRMKILMSLIILVTVFHVYKFFEVRLSSMGLPRGRIVFSASVDGDSEVYSMNINGTSLKQLTRNSATKTSINIAIDREASFSPDGGSVIFTSGRQGSENRELIFNINGKPIGEKFSGGASDIFIMDLDGSNQIPLTYQDLASAPFFSPDGKNIIFRSNKPTSLRIMNTSTLKEGVLSFGGGQVEFSSDGKKIFDNFKNGIEVGDVGGTEIVRLTNFSDSREIGNSRTDRLGIFFTLSKNNDKIGIAVIENKNNRPSRIFKFYTMNTDGSGLEEKYKLETKDIGILFEFKYSPDGNTIILAAQFDELGIYSLNLTNNNLINLTNKKEKWDAFSMLPFTFTPDGKRVIFMANISPKDYRAALQLYKIKAWLKYFVLRRKSPSYDNKYLCIMDIDGKNYRRITKLPVGTELGRDFIHWEK